MNQPWIYMCSPSRSPLPPPTPSHPSGSSQCTSPEHSNQCQEEKRREKRQAGGKKSKREKKKRKINLIYPLSSLQLLMRAFKWEEKHAWKYQWTLNTFFWYSRSTRISFCVCFFVSESRMVKDLFSSDNTTAWAVYTDPSSRTLKSGSLDWMWSTDLRHSFKLTASKNSQIVKCETRAEKGEKNILIMYTIFSKPGSGVKWINQSAFSKYLNQPLYTYFFTVIILFLLKIIILDCMFV